MDYSIIRSGLAVPASYVMKQNGWGLISNANVDAAAAIAYSKLNLANSIVSADIAAGTIVDSDISGSAAIALSKLANPTANYVLRGGGGGSVVADLLYDANIAAGAAIAYSKLNLANSIVSTDITNGTIVNEDISGSAAIAYSKLNLAGSITLADFATLTPTSFTPTWTQSATISKTVNKAVVYNFGKLAIIIIMMTATSAGTANNDVVITLPTSSPDLTMGVDQYRILGPVTCFDSGTDYKMGQAVAQTSTTIKVSRDTKAGYLGSAADAYTVASGDIFSTVLTVNLA